MIPAEILKQVRRIHIQTSRMVNDILAGEYVSTFKGSGIEFDEVREYQIGDDIRSIDWNVTARTGLPHIKRFVEERELTVILMVDASSSGYFGSTSKLKNEIATELCAVLAFSAIKNNDKVGLIIFTDRIEKFLPPKKGKKHVLRVIRELLCFEPKRNKTDIELGLAYLNRVITRKAVVFMVSDFLSGGFEKSLRIANKKHDVIGINIIDPRELELPALGFIELMDAETGESIIVDTYDADVRAGFSLLSNDQLAKRRDLFKSMNVDLIEIQTDKPYIDPMMKFFRMREKRR
ncbi:MAG: DUF58 domain-containing protein [Candidatus Auribacter fodinae]|jgi:uncharacterized protein (DUF58 family)|uniref:DUF58 domain-containing protein n=1 Tax=Candidatus Auribacter fodinae TaxID=2093366 RepID=A0A3A4R7B2_9BACT|nr:MAG: DUF58 domain-containing protein [Candidatus Auribacter fodinae]